MNRMHRHLLGVVVALACVPALAENHAMIVGVTKYPALANLRHGQGMDLKGPANDAGLVTDVLLQRGFKKSLIVELSERMELLQQQQALNTELAHANDALTQSNLDLQ